MPNLTHNALVICPFYLRVANNGCAVVCEGLAPGSEIANCFTGKAKLENWLEKACETMEYKKHCPLARAVERKYG